MWPALLAAAVSISAENQRPGTPDWDISRPALHREIEGYASRTSVDAGEPIDLFINTAADRYTIDVFRMGWYGGAGARRVAGPIDRRGVRQPLPQADAATGLLECRWIDPVHLETRDAAGPWTTGVYLARLTTRPAAPGSPAQSFIVFVVRHDGGDAPIVFQSSVTTFAAYNNWGGRSLYAFNSGNAPARKVSFDRPYAADAYGVRLDGAGDFLRRWEYNAVRFLEREGYDVRYVTDVDTHARGVDGARVFLSVGHDEYWSWAMRSALDTARDRGVHLAFLAADAGYWQIRFEPDATGVPDRTIVAYKEAAAALDPLARDHDPRNDRYVTGRFRDAPASRPEERLVGVMYAADPVDGDIIVDAPRHWVFAGTGLARGDALRGLLGYEVDAIYGDGPRGLERLAHSPFGDQGRTRYADMTMYRAASGAWVFATGSMQWNWGLDDYNAPAWHPARADARAQRVTRNVIDRMLADRPSPTPVPSRAGPSVVVTIAAIGSALWVLRAWWISRSGDRARSGDRDRPGARHRSDFPD
ncbi:MAG TPA: N,N-dimethylformamidase beta subunit family domain-containing protein [Vicinamibacterales bacterium]|nr:N,N-dimethylformamidase beta subunit family domain-containing protein [Vicinamibacterales bacterium]